MARSKRFAKLEEQQALLPPKREAPVAELKHRAAEAAINGTLHWNNLQLQTPLPPGVQIPPNVFHLKLGNNEFVEFPKEVLALRQLQVLELNANLMSALPPQISAIESLQTLYLNNNRLGVLPPEIGLLTNLAMLDLHGNRLHEVPLELCSCTNLTKLDVSDNMLRIPFQRIEHVSIPDLLTVLRIFHMSEKSKELRMLQREIDHLQSTVMEQAHRLCTVLTSLFLPCVEVGEVTDLIKDFSPLQLLCFSGCSIPSVSPAIGDLSTNLSFIDFRRNAISGLPPAFEGLGNLATLLLDDNKVAAFPKCVIECKSLTHLSLRCNVLEEVPPEFGALKNLKVVCLGKNKLVDLPVELCSLEKLEVLELVNNSIDTMPLYLLKEAESMEFAMPPLVQGEDVLIDDLCASGLLEQEQGLLSLAAEWYEPTQVLVYFFRQLEVGMRELTLDLSGIGLTSVPIPVIDLTHLTSLSLSTNHMPQLPLALVELSKLVVLNVQDNLEMEWMTQEAVKAPEQYVLQLQARLRDGIPTRELDITQLRLRLLPGNVQEMDSISKLYAAHNELVALPPDIGEQATFAGLQHLDISHNLLRSLPASLGNILSLEYLDCSHNNLKSVAAELAQCTNLTSLQLKNNPTLESPPPHVVDTGLQACLEFLLELLLSRKADKLNLDRYQFHRVPVNLAEYMHITEISMCENDMLVLPEQLCDMKALQKLDVRRNRLQHFPEALGAMLALRVIHADDNQLKTLPISFPHLPMLRICTLANNQLTWIPNQVGNMNSVTEFVISGNPLRSPPLDIVEQGTFRILRYLRNLHSSETTNALDLSALGLIALPLMICRQTALTELKLFKNKISEVPVKMSRLTNLTRLVLSANNITTIPPILQHLTDVRRLYIDDNHLEELSKTCFLLTQLKELRVAGNNLQQIPDDIWKLQDMLLLDISRNELTTLPDSFAHLTGLKKLRLMHNKFERLPLTLAKLLSLEELHIGQNPLIDVPPNLCTLPKLRVMQMDSCDKLESPPPEIRDRGFKDVMAFLYRVYEAQRTMVLDMAWLDLKILYINPMTLSGLTRLNLSGNQFEDLPHEIPFLTNLRCLTFDENKLKVLPPSLGTITSIEKLSFKGNPVGSPPQDITDRGTEAIMSYLRRLYVANLTQHLDLSFQGIEILHLSICQLTNIVFLSLDDNGCETLPREIHFLSCLTELSVQRNKLTSLPDTIGRLKLLQILRLDFNPTLKLLPPELSKASSLAFIGHEGDTILSPGMEVLAKGVKPVLSYLACLLEAVQTKKLILTAAGLNTFAMYLAARATCMHLDLSNNYLDIMEPSIMTFVTLRHIDVSHNRIKEIPGLIGNLRELVTIRADGNLLTELPSSMGFIEALETLSVSENGIQTLPGEFGNLSSLSELDVSGNGMTDLLPELSNVTTLTSINLARNKVTSLPADWGVLTLLVQLDVTGNPLVDPPLELRRKGVVHSLRYLRKIRDSLYTNVLDLRGLNLEDVASVLDRNHNLLKVHLDNNRIKHLPSLIGRLRVIEELSITNNQIKILPAELGLCTTLKSLKLDADVIISPPPDIIVEDVDVILRYLREFASAKLTNHLDLTGSKHRDVPAVMMDMTNLTFLSLGSNVLEDLPAEIASMERLTHLDVSGNKLQGVPAELGKLTNLTFLSIAHNNLTSLSREMRHLTNLTEFKIKCQELFSPPPELHDAGAQPILKYLRCVQEGIETDAMKLDDCRLIEIPDEVLKITSLRSLSIRHNKIKTVPIGLGDLVNLEGLYADHNLIVSITPLIWQLKALSEIGLSHNNMRSLPPEFGLFVVKKIKVLNLAGCKHLRSPPEEIVAQGPPVIIPYLKIMWESRDTKKASSLSLSLLIVTPQKVRA